MVSLTSFLTLAAVTIVVMMTSYQGVKAEINLLPSWSSGGSRSRHHPVTSTRSGTNCATYLDINIHGNPDCPLDQQFFDTHTCQFVCDVLLEPSPSRNRVTLSKSP